MNSSETERSGLPAQTDVLIAGAGPTGMALAIALQQAGIDHIIVDKLPEGLNTSRAGVIHAHTLEVLEELGVSHTLAEQGLKLTDFRIRDRDRTLLRLRFDDLPSLHRYVLMLPQDISEKILSERLSALGGGIHRGVTVTAVEQQPEGARVALSTPSGEAVVEAKYVVGGDGMHSIVREACGTEFEGGTYGHAFVLADVRMDWPLDTNEVSLFFSPSGLLVIAPLPNDVFRVVATVERAPEQPTLEDIQILLDTRGPATGSSRVKELLWSSRFRIHHRVAKAYRKGRLLLMGDAAHVHSPAGGQGMNTGIVDAVVLGRLLTRAIQSGCDSALDGYEEMRRPAATQVLALAGRLTSLATVRSASRRGLRNLALTVMNHIPPVRRSLAMHISGLSRKALAGMPSAETGRMIELEQSVPAR